jgi:peptidoglycan/LPS O-acetylase OafA/YrhL
MRRTLATARIPGADGLRAIACLLVIWHHTAQKLNPEGLSPLVGVLHFLGMRGEVGVSLFFVLSGCLLSVPFWASFVERKPFPSIKRYCPSILVEPNYLQHTCSRAFQLGVQLAKVCVRIPVH